MSNATTDPYDLQTWLTETTTDAIEQTPEYQLARSIYDQLQTLYADATGPRWSSWWDQASRAALSVALNWSQGAAKAKGHTGADWLCARGELAELLAALAVGPPSSRPLRQPALQLYRLLSARIANLPKRPTSYG